MCGAEGLSSTFTSKFCVQLRSHLLCRSVFAEFFPEGMRFRLGSPLKALPERPHKRQANQRARCNADVAIQTITRGVEHHWQEPVLQFRVSLLQDRNHFSPD